MDNLSSLSSDLPAQASAAQELAQLDSSIISEFKTAACAVTKLYKLSGAKQAVVRQQGYLAAIQDLLDFMTSSPHGGSGARNADEVLAWALQKQEDFNANSANSTGINNRTSNSNNKNSKGNSRIVPSAPTSLMTSENHNYSPTSRPTSAEAVLASTAKKAAAERKEFSFHAPDNVATLNMQNPLPTTVQSFSGNLFNFDPSAILSSAMPGSHHHHHHYHGNFNNNGSNSNNIMTASITSANSASSESDQEDDLEEDFVSSGNIAEDMKKRIKYSGTSNLDFKRHRY